MNLTKPSHFKPLYSQEYVFCVLFGGRSSGKSHEMAELAVTDVLDDKANILCVREKQNSLAESNWELVVQKINSLGLSDYFKIVESKSTIYCVNGRRIVFKGLSNLTEQSIKSFEGFNYAWVEEAQYLQDSSLDILIPTIIRNDNPRIFFTMNPMRESDAVYRRYIARDREDTLKIKVNYMDNPYNNDEVFKEAEKCRIDEGEMVYRHIWLGEPVGETPAQFISNKLIEDAMFKKSTIAENQDYPVIISCDNARMGDDHTVISMRQGNLFKVLERIKKNDDDFIIASIIAEFQDEYKADAVFIDAGYGHGLKDIGRTMNRKWRLVNFGSKAMNKSLQNKRAEMYYKLREWLKEGGTLPDDPVLKAELKSIEIKPSHNGVIGLRSKDDMKKEGKPSPDIADSLALTFAFQVVNNNIMNRTKAQQAFNETRTNRGLKQFGDR